MKTFNNIPAKEWHWTILVARMHSMMWVIFTPYMCIVLYFFVKSIIDSNHNPHRFGAIVLSSIMFVFLAFANISGIHACWLCKKFGIDWNKNWHQQ